MLNQQLISFDVRPPPFVRSFDVDAAKFGWFVMFFGGFVIFMSFL